MKEDKFKDFRGRVFCSRCRAGFENKEDLIIHKSEMHGEYEIDVHKAHIPKDATIKKIFLRSKQKTNKVKTKSAETNNLAEFVPTRQEMNRIYKQLEEEEIGIIWELDYTHIREGWGYICHNCFNKVYSTHRHNMKTDLLLCFICGYNVFRFNRNKVFNWLNDVTHLDRVLPKSMVLKEERVNFDIVKLGEEIL